PLLRDQHGRRHHRRAAEPRRGHRDRRARPLPVRRAPRRRRRGARQGGPPLTDEELVYRASAARARAYAPYSKFEVGVAVLADGDVFDGANVENASYGLALCAERNAIARAVLEGCREISVMAVFTETSPPAAPCGMCLQTLCEFSPDPAQTRIL